MTVSGGAPHRDEGEENLNPDVISVPQAETPAFDEEEEETKFEQREKETSLRPGDLIDVLDTVGKWSEAQV